MAWKREYKTHFLNHCFTQRMGNLNYVKVRKIIFFSQYTITCINAVVSYLKNSFLLFLAPLIFLFVFSFLICHFRFISSLFFFFKYKKFLFHFRACLSVCVFVTVCTFLWLHKWYIHDVYQLKIFHFFPSIGFSLHFFYFVPSFYLVSANSKKGFYKSEKKRTKNYFILHMCVHMYRANYIFQLYSYVHECFSFLFRWLRIDVSTQQKATKDTKKTPSQQRIGKKNYVKCLRWIKKRAIKLNAQGARAL